MVAALSFKRSVNSKDSGDPPPGCEPRSPASYTACHLGPVIASSVPPFPPIQGGDSGNPTPVKMAEAENESGA